MSNLHRICLPPTTDCHPLFVPSLISPPPHPTPERTHAPTCTCTRALPLYRGDLAALRRELKADIRDQEREQAIYLEVCVGWVCPVWWGRSR